MQSVGQQIRETRLRLGLTLDSISANSRIPIKKLQAIEADDLTSLGSPFFYKSFVRQFSEHLKLDWATLGEAVESATATMPQPRMPGEDQFSDRAKIAPIPVKRGRGNYRWLYSVASLGVMMIACSSFYGLWQNSKTTRLASLLELNHSARSASSEASLAPLPAAQPAESSPAPASHQQPLSSTKPSNTGSSTSAPTIPLRAPETLDGNQARNNADPTVSADQSNPEFRVELSAIERTWLSIIEDGKETFRGVLDATETKVLEGHETARIRTGNAGGISCVFNGKSIGPLGPRGQVRTVVFTKSNYEVLDLPAHIALTSYSVSGE